MEFKEAKLIRSNEDGYYQSRIEQIEIGWGGGEVLDISNRKPNLWIFSLFNGYRQIGWIKGHFPNFKEGQDVIVKLKKGKIVEVIDDK